MQRGVLCSAVRCRRGRGEQREQHSSTAAVTLGVSCVLLRLAGEGTLEVNARARFPPLSPGQTTTSPEPGVCALRAAACGIQH